MPTITEAFAEYVVNAKYQDLSPAAVDMAKLSILDSVGCALAGSRTDIGMAIINLVEYLGGRLESPLLGTTEKTSCTNASFANAEMADALDMNDTYPYSSHPGAPIVQSAISVGCAKHVSGEDFVTAVTIGYEIATRIGSFVMNPMFRSSAVSGCGFMIFGVTGLTARLLKLSKHETAMAMGIAGMASPVSSTERGCLNPFNAKNGAPMVKNHYGVMADLGVRSALLAQRGYTGPIDIFEGNTGYPVMFGIQNYTPDHLEQILKNLGTHEQRPPRILNLWFKPYPCFIHAHPAIDAALQIQKEQRLNAADIDEIIVKTFSLKAQPPLNDCDPKTVQSAIMSFPYSVAAALLGVNPSLEWHSDATRKRADLHELSHRVKVVADPEADALRKQGHATVASVRISSRGVVYERRVVHPKGSVQNPMTREELTEKFLNLASVAIHNEASKDLLRLIENTERIKDLEELSKALLAAK
jgi:2-methylcitrate dehydratase PrpD